MSPTHQAGSRCQWAFLTTPSQANVPITEEHQTSPTQQACHGKTSMVEPSSSEHEFGVGNFYEITFASMVSDKNKNSLS